MYLFLKASQFYVYMWIVRLISIPPSGFYKIYNIYYISYIYIFSS